MTMLRSYREVLIHVVYIVPTTYDNYPVIVAFWLSWILCAPPPALTHLSTLTTSDEERELELEMEHTREHTRERMRKLKEKKKAEEEARKKVEEEKRRQEAAARANPHLPLQSHLSVENTDGCKMTTLVLCLLLRPVFHC
ncbi:hypothetical protein EV368DRAFT_70026 [Lentinula lateritia]|nr:hypothetical protein EV368DRAFT_70026 [Lentinula lateritia]